MGQDKVESLYTLPLDTNKVYNFGWNYYEGSLPYKKDKIKKDLSWPIFEYPNEKDVGQAITGGYFVDTDKIITSDFLGIVRVLQKRGNKWVEISNNKVDDHIYSINLVYDNLFLLCRDKIYITKFNQV